MCQELESTLKSCKESSAGSDSITYKCYLFFWDLVGTFLLDARNYSVENNQLCGDQRISTRTLLEKKGQGPE